MNVLFHEHETHFDPNFVPVDATIAVHHEVEAPDQGVIDEEHEAPERPVRRRHSESPEAGTGRMGVLEHEFTHGRSQS